jgi:hypothetical protein
MTAMDDAAADAKRRAGKNQAPKSPATSELLTVTIQAKTGKIVKIQSAEAGGGLNVVPTTLGSIVPVERSISHKG